MKTLHLVCNAHLDPVWQWSAEEGIGAALSTFASAVKLAEKYDYIFCHNEAWLYECTERYAPDLFEKIKKLINEGKWRVIGGWFLQPDCLMPSGEAMFRQIEKGMRYFEEKFGVRPQVAVNFDPFGHSRGLVQILNKCGQTGYMFMRPYGPYIRKQLDLPAEEFLWRGYDGSTVCAVRTTEYNSPLGNAVEKIRLDMKRHAEKETGYSMWGVGNHGGGPSSKDLANIGELIETEPVNIIHSYPEKLFSDLKFEKEYDGSLIVCMPGCYTSMNRVKKGYSALETKFFFAEKICAAAAMKTGMKYPQKSLESAERDMLVVQFHDILPGSCVESGEKYALERIAHAGSELREVIDDAFFRMIGDGKPVGEGEYPIYVFNPKTYAYKARIACEMSVIQTDLYEEERTYPQVYDEAGNALPTQTVKEESSISLDWRKNVLFEGVLQPFSMNRFIVKTSVRKVEHLENGTGDIVFENKDKRVVIGKKSGLIEEYVVCGKKYNAGPLFRPYLYEDNADPWGMSDEQRLNGIGKNPQEFLLTEKPTGVFSDAYGVRIVEDGEVCLCAEAFFRADESMMRLTYKIYKEGPEVDVSCDLYCMNPDSIVKLSVAAEAEEVLGGQMYGEESLFADGRECIFQKYVALQQEKDYLQVITGDLYGCSYREGALRLNLVRTAAYCAHPVENRPLLREGIYTPRMDMGKRTFDFRMTVGKKTELNRNKDIYIEKPYAVQVFPSGKSEIKKRGFETDNPAISVASIRRTKKHGYLLRLYNGNNSSQQTELKVSGVRQVLQFGAFEVKTVVFDGKKIFELKNALN